MLFKELFVAQKDLIKVTVAALVLIVGIGLIVVRGAGGPDRRGAPAPQSNYFYDLGTGELFTQPVAALPPVTAPSGGEGVRAFVFTCGECTPSQLVVGYLQRLNEKAIEVSGRLAQVEDTKRQALYTDIQGGTFVAAPPAAGEQPRWMPIITMESKALLQAHMRMCPGEERAMLCTPDKAK